MSENCRDNGASYQGRVEGTKQLTRIKRKVPIIVSDALDMYAFPLNSPREPACCWLLLDYIYRVDPDGKRGSTIYFKNGMRVSVPVTPRVIDYAYKKA